eukprot:CAMPEP_0114580786 /NCGR_PEP_ID=MMETSP0125-20121206/4991_1 /TAXON_ID=485358 ORGANISM="Aristerostoma sp., Strain ATCC 50986" /NCGR_SAMPLE_ID=MMETSP0125 /ASSEMBLY_ACC=CAM_ASM_000245 /LENGTH=106 /DNA_ID=CAMNT_0001772535 /DNA_START=1532 /DNA_END=1849 /DNA_ORIENTATION=+
MGDVSWAYSFTTYFPLILIALCLFNMFDIYGKLLTFFGLSRFKFSEDFSDEKIDDGKKILERARLKMQRNKPTSMITNSLYSKIKDGDCLLGNQDAYGTANTGSPD